MNRLKKVLERQHGDKIYVGLKKGRPNTCEIMVDDFLIYSKLEHKKCPNLPSTIELKNAINKCIAGQCEKIVMESAFGGARKATKT